MVPMTSPAQYLTAYDDQLRTDAETPGAIDVTRLGPLHLVTFEQGRGFITYRDLAEMDEQGLGDLITGALEHYRADPSITCVEWKTRAHDHAPGLHEALTAHGFEPGEAESIMIGPLEALCQGVEGAVGGTVRRVTSEAEVRAMSAMLDEAVGEGSDLRSGEELVARLARGDGLELWVAEAAGRIVCGGRLEPVAGTEFVGIWGGATLEAYRGRGIYRALTAERARSALRQGKKFVHSDSTEFSRPILERAGLLTVSTTTPYTCRLTRPR